MKTQTMKIAVLFAAASALSDSQLKRLKEINDLRKAGAFTASEYQTHKQSIVNEGAPRRSLSDKNNVAKSKCLAGMVNKMAGDVAKASNDATSVKNANTPAVAAIIKYLVTQAPKVSVSGGSDNPSTAPVTCQSNFTCSCQGSGSGSSGSRMTRASCNTKACLQGWTLFDNYRELKCQANSCDPDRDNAQCCTAGKWYEKGTYMTVKGATLTQNRNDWDSARASAWITTGKTSVQFVVTKYMNSQMIGAVRKTGAQWTSHVHSGKVGDAHPDGWVWYSSGGRFYNYSPQSGTFKRWGGPNAHATNMKIRVYLDADNRQIFIYANGQQIASWTNINVGEGICAAASLYYKGAALTIVAQNPGHDEGWGAWREWGDMMERKDMSIYLRVQNNWETARASPWISTGARTVSFKVHTMKNSMMMGCYRKDYMNYNQHPHSSSQGDIYPEGWVWYTSGGRFYNYVPYGGTFKRTSTASNGWKTNEYTRVKADATERSCRVYWRKGSSGSFTQIAQWTNLNIGRGMAIGISCWDKDNGMTIVKEGASSDKEGESRSACGSDACYNTWTPHDNARELYCKGSKCNPDKDNDTCCHVGKWLDKGTNLKVTSDNIIVHRRQGDWDSARASAWITKGRQSVTFKVALMKTYMMIGAIRKDGVQWNNHVHSSKVGDAHPDGWVWYSAGNSFYNYVPLSGSFKRWGGPNVFRTNHKVRVYVDADKKQVFIFCNGNQVASWSNCAWGSGVSVGASFYDVDSSLEILQLTPGKDSGFGAWMEWGMMMERQGSTIFMRINSNWETARASKWLSSGSETVSMKVVYSRGSTMIGCYRRDYMSYEQHPHSSSQGDIHPEAWVWYTSGGRFYNYVPFGGTFKRVSTVTNSYTTNQYVRIKADASGRACYASWRKSDSGSFTLIAQWTNLNIGKGMAVGISAVYNNEAFQIVEEK